MPHWRPSPQLGLSSIALTVADTRLTIGAIAGAAVIVALMPALGIFGAGAVVAAFNVGLGLGGVGGGRGPGGPENAATPMIENPTDEAIDAYATSDDRFDKYGASVVTGAIWSPSS